MLEKLPADLAILLQPVEIDFAVHIHRDHQLHLIPLHAQTQNMTVRLQLGNRIRVEQDLLLYRFPLFLCHDAPQLMVSFLDVLLVR